MVKAIMALEGIYFSANNGKAFCEKHDQSLFYAYYRRKGLIELVCQICEDENFKNPKPKKEGE